MSGLLEQSAQQGTGAAPADMSPMASPEARKVPPAESAGELNQQDLDMMVANGMKLVHDAKVSDRLIKNVADSRNPVPALADATINIVARLEQSAEKAGKKLSPVTVAYGANYIMGEIITLAEAAGMEKIDDNEKYRAFSLAVGKYLDDAVKTGKMTKEQVIQMGREAEGTDLGQKMAGTEMGGEMPEMATGNAPTADTGTTGRI